MSNLVFRFNKSLYPDSLINNWDSTAYISFEPKIQGRFRWNGPDELVFSPAQPLLPATNYKATIKDDVLHYSKFNNVRDERDQFLHIRTYNWMMPRLPGYFRMKIAVGCSANQSPIQLSG